MATETNEIAQVERRIADLTAWLKENAPACGVEQKHLEEGSQERVYWHYGYMVALRDTLQLLTGQSRPKRDSADMPTFRQMA